MTAQPADIGYDVEALAAAGPDEVLSELPS
jgi:hypothetical protein